MANDPHHELSVFLIPEKKYGLELGAGDLTRFCPVSPYESHIKSPGKGGRRAGYLLTPGGSEGSQWSLATTQRR